MPAYPFLASDYPSLLSLFTHHQWIGGFFIVGAGAHAGLVMVYDIRPMVLGFIDRLQAHKHSFIVHLNWLCIFLSLFWMYNSISVVIFHFSWKLQSDVWGSVEAFRASHVTDGNFSRSS